MIVGDERTKEGVVAMTGRQPDASSVALAYDAILGRIVSGELRVGSPLKSTTLARELGMSRTPVVQAIARLCSEGLLNQERNHRAVVAAGAERWFMSLHEVRILLEPTAAREAAGKLPKPTLDRLHELAAQFEQQEDTARRDAAFRFDHELHTSIADAAQNLWIKSIVHKCMSYKRFAYKIPNDPPQRLARSHREHLEILHAVEQGDGETASAAMLFHLRSTFRDLPDRHVV